MNAVPALASCSIFFGFGFGVMLLSERIASKTPAFICWTLTKWCGLWHKWWATVWYGLSLLCLRRVWYAFMPIFVRWNAELVRLKHLSLTEARTADPLNPGLPRCRNVRFWRSRVDCWRSWYASATSRKFMHRGDLLFPLPYFMLFQLFPVKTGTLSPPRLAILAAIYRNISFY